MGFDVNGWLMDQAYELARDRDVIVTIEDAVGKKRPVNLYAAGLRYDVCGYISISEFILVIDLLDGNKIIYDGYHHCFSDYIPGQRVAIDEAREAPIFAKNMNKLMREQKISDAVLAVITRISIKRIRKYMNGECLPNCDHLLRICGALRCFITDLTLQH